MSGGMKVFSHLMKVAYSANALVC